MCCTIVSRITSRLGQTFPVFRQVSSDSLSFFFGYDLSIFPAISFLRYSPPPFFFAFAILRWEETFTIIEDYSGKIWYTLSRISVWTSGAIRSKCWYFYYTGCTANRGTRQKGFIPCIKSNTIWFNNQNDLILVRQETIFTMQMNYDMNKT